MAFDDTVTRLKERMRDLLTHNIFPKNTMYVVNTSQPRPSQGGQAAVNWARLGTSAVIVKRFKERGVYEREFTVHAEAYIRLYGSTKGIPPFPIITAPIYLGDGTHFSTAQTLLPRARDLFNYVEEMHPPEAYTQLGPLIHNALRRLHWHGVIHGDISADNILVYETGADKPRIAFIDFGMGQVTSDDRPLSESDLMRAAKSFSIPGTNRKFLSPKSDYVWMTRNNEDFVEEYSPIIELLIDVGCTTSKRLCEMITHVHDVRQIVGWTTFTLKRKREGTPH